MADENEGVTELLGRWRSGDGAAFDRLIPLVYAELHRLARRYLKSERPGHTLQSHEPELCRILDLRFFGGLTIEETAEVLNISDSTVKRQWILAKTWIFRELSS